MLDCIISFVGCYCHMPAGTVHIKFREGLVLMFGFFCCQILELLPIHTAPVSGFN